jgi:hypothetical protein
MAKTGSAIGADVWVAKARFKRRCKPLHLRGRKSLGPKSGMKGKK